MSRVVPQQLPATILTSNATTLSRYYSSHKKGRHEKEFSDSDSDSDSDKSGKAKRVNMVARCLCSKAAFDKLVTKFGPKFVFQLQGNTEFWRKKMRTLHNLLDVNNDGVISYDDFKLLADKFTALGHLKHDAHDEFLTVLQQTWEEQWGEISPYNLISAEQYLKEMHHTVNDKELRGKIHKFLPYLFKVSSEHRRKCFWTTRF